MDFLRARVAGSSLEAGKAALTPLLVMEPRCCVPGRGRAPLRDCAGKLRAESNTVPPHGKVETKAVTAGKTELEKKTFLPLPGLQHSLSGFHVSGLPKEPAPKP